VILINCGLNVLFDTFQLIKINQLVMSSQVIKLNKMTMSNKLSKNKRQYFSASFKYSTLVSEIEKNVRWKLTTIIRMTMVQWWTGLMKVALVKREGAKNLVRGVP